MEIRTNSVVGYDGESSVELPDGFSVGILTAQGNVNVTSGVSTVYNIVGTNLNLSGVCTVSNLVGSGANMTGLTSITSSKVTAFKLIFDPLPFRA